MNVWTLTKLNAAFLPVGYTAERLSVTSSDCQLSLDGRVYETDTASVNCDHLGNVSMIMFLWCHLSVCFFVCVRPTWEYKSRLEGFWNFTSCGNIIPNTQLTDIPNFVQNGQSSQSHRISESCCIIISLQWRCWLLWMSDFPNAVSQFDYLSEFCAHGFLCNVKELILRQLARLCAQLCVVVRTRPASWNWSEMMKMGNR